MRVYIYVYVCTHTAAASCSRCQRRTRRRELLHARPGLTSKLTDLRVEICMYPDLLVDKILVHADLNSGKLY